MLKRAEAKLISFRKLSSTLRNYQEKAKIIIVRLEISRGQTGSQFFSYNTNTSIKNNCIEKTFV